MPTPQTPPPWRGGSFTGPLPAGFEVPSWVQGATPEQRQSDYMTYLRQNPNARGNRILHRATGFNPAFGFQAPSAPPGAAPPPPAGAPPPGQPGPPIFPSPAAPAAPAGGGAPPSGGPPPGMPGSMPAPGAFNDPFSMFLSAVPGMRMNTTRQIGDAMAQAGFTGNRWGTSAMGKAGEIGAQGAAMENALLQKTLYDYANQVENRALQATGMGMGLGGMLDQMAQSRVRLPFELGQYEQQRADQMAMLPYLDFERNKLGWLPMLQEAAMSQGSGSPGQIFQTQTQGKPGAADWLTLLGGLFGGFG